ncbi:MAG: YciI family protein [Ilumatobacteraceae bacterium]
MKYMLIIYGNEMVWESLPPDQLSTLIRETDALWTELRRTGEFIGAYGLADQSAAKMVHTNGDGVPAVTDGPFIEAKEYIGSFAIIDVDTEARAYEIAAANPSSRLVGVEVRPVMHEAGEEM